VKCLKAYICVSDCQSGVWQASSSGFSFSFYSLHASTGQCYQQNGSLGCSCPSGNSTTLLTETNSLYSINLYICTPKSSRLIFRAGKDSSKNYHTSYRLDPGQCMELAPVRKMTSCTCENHEYMGIVLPNLNYMQDLHVNKANYLVTDSYLFSCT